MFRSIPMQVEAEKQKLSENAEETDYEIFNCEGDKELLHNRGLLVCSAGFNLKMPKLNKSPSTIAAKAYVLHYTFPPLHASFTCTGEKRVSCSVFLFDNVCQAGIAQISSRPSRPLATHISLVPAILSSGER